MSQIRFYISDISFAVTLEGLAIWLVMCAGIIGIAALLNYLERKGLF